MSKMTNTLVYKDHFGRPLVRGDWIISAQRIHNSANIRVARVKDFYPKSGLKVSKALVDRRWDNNIRKYVNAGITFVDSIFKRPKNCIIIDPTILPIEYVEAYKNWEPAEEE